MSNQIVITSGAKVRELEGVLTGTTGIVNALPINGSLGIPQLDVNGKILVSQLPNSVMEYQGTWNVTTNTPYLVDGVGNQGDVYIVTNAASTGTAHNFGSGSITFFNGDQAIYSGTIWQRASGATGTVTSVGLSTDGNAITIGSSPITTSGTITANFAGTSGQYINGAGNLTTFPSLTGYVPYTGATSDVDLDAHVLNAQALHVKGTAGNGHLGLKHQSASATGSANESLLFADVNGDLGWQNGNLYSTTLSTHSNTANRTYTFPDASGTIALTSDIPTVSGTANYIPKFTGTNSIGNSVISYNSGSNFDEINISQASTPNYNTISVFANTESRLYLNSSNNDRLIAYNSYGVVAFKYESSTSSNFLFRYDGYSTKNLTIQTNGSDRITVNSAGTFRLNAYTTNGLLKTSNADGTFAIATAGTDYVVPSALSSYVPYTGATGSVDLGSNDLTSYAVKANILEASLNGTASSPLILRTGTSGFASGLNAISLISSPTSANTLTIISNASSITKTAQIGLGSLTATRTYTLPDASGTLALTSDIPSLANYVTLNTTQTITAQKSFSGGVLINNGSILLQNGVNATAAGYTGFGVSTSGTTDGFRLYFGNGYNSGFNFNNTSTYTYTLPAATGTLALTSDLGSYLPLSGGTLTGTLNSNSLIYTTSNFKTDSSVAFKNISSGGTAPSSLAGYSQLYFDTYQLSIRKADNQSINIRYPNSALTQTWDFNVEGYIAVQYNASQTTGGVSFVRSTGQFTQDATKFFWDDTNKRLGIGNAAPSYTLDVSGTGRFTSTLLVSGAATFSSSVTAGGLVTINKQNEGLILTAGANTDASYMSTRANNGTGWMIMGSQGTTAGYIQSGTGANESAITTVGAYALSLGTNQVERMRITSGGNMELKIPASTNQGILYKDSTGVSRAKAYYDDISGEMTIGTMTGYSTVFVTNNTEKMRITSGGDVYIGSSTVTTANVSFYLEKTSGAFTQVFPYSSGTKTIQEYYRQSGGSIGSISYNGTITAYNSTSDYRLKEDLKDYNALSIISKLKTYDFKWKEAQVRDYGMMAHELQEVLPSYVIGQKDEIDKDGNIKAQGVDYSKIVPILVKAIQELEARVKKLENK